MFRVIKWINALSKVKSEDRKLSCKWMQASQLYLHRKEKNANWNPVSQCNFTAARAGNGVTAEVDISGWVSVIGYSRVSHFLPHQYNEQSTFGRSGKLSRQYLHATPPLNLSFHDEIKNDFKENRHFFSAAMKIYWRHLKNFILSPFQWWCLLGGLLIYDFSLN